MSTFPVIGAWIDSIPFGLDFDSGSDAGLVQSPSGSVVSFTTWSDAHYNVPGDWVSSSSDSDSEASESELEELERSVVFDGASDISDSGSSFVLPGSHWTESDFEDDDNSDAESETSTVQYEHEPFETYQHRAVALARSRVWPELSSETPISAEKMHGGYFNRCIGLNVGNVDDDSDESSDSQGIRAILRIPRSLPTDIDQEIGTHLFVQQRVPDVPVAELLSFSLTEDNEIESPFAVQRRVMATNLVEQYANLDQATKCRVARELGNAIRHMTQTKSSVLGDMMPPTADGQFSIAAFDYHRVIPFASALVMVKMEVAPRDPAFTHPYDGSGHIETPIYDLLKTTFEAQKAEYHRRFPRQNHEHFDGFLAMLEDMRLGGYLDDDMPYTLAHMDLGPQNVLFDPQADSQSQSITVLDWDIAGFQPVFMACEPPMWLWAWPEDDQSYEWDEKKANHVPETAENQEIKAAFEQAAGPDYMRYAYNPVYRLGRTLVDFSQRGLHCDEDDERCKDMLDEWAAIRSSFVKEELDN